MLKYIVILLLIASSTFARLGDSFDAIQSRHSTEPIFISDKPDGFYAFKYVEGRFIDTFIFNKNDICVVEIYLDQDDSIIPEDALAQLLALYSDQWDNFETSIPGAIAFIAQDKSVVIILGGGKAGGLKYENIVTIMSKEWVNYISRVQFIKI